MQREKAEEHLARLDPRIARAAVNALSTGEPPSPSLVPAMSIGLDEDLATFVSEYFGPETFVVDRATKGSTFKVIQAYYGGGKTHYLRAVEATAHEHGFASAFVSLKKDECPLTRFDLVYRAVADSLTVRVGNQTVTGLGNVIRAWTAELGASGEDAVQEVERRTRDLTDLPLMSMKVALRSGAIAAATGDTQMLNEVLIYLTSGNIAPPLRKEGILEKIDAKTGSLALRSLVKWLMQLEISGFLLMLDEGDRSLSLTGTKDQQAASNNLVQLINETATEGAWPGTVLLYSIPSWDSFETAFSHNEALMQRVRATGFPDFPPAPRIVLDVRVDTEQQKLRFCEDLAVRLDKLFAAAYPDAQVQLAARQSAATRLSKQVIELEVTSSFRRLFVQSYLRALYQLRTGKALSDGDVTTIVTNQQRSTAKEG